ncbi:MAG: hypothetical protein CFH01_01898, partial [Alphaproteobacteria bacterium MarineAlpha2_Bin1]
ENGKFFSEKGAGHVGDIFSDEKVIDKLPGNYAIGHNRYSTSGETNLRNVQPIFAEFEFGGFALSHNGNLTNAKTLRKNLVKQGCIFQSTLDTEVIIHLMATSRHHEVVDRFIDSLRQVEGAYSLVALCNETIIGVRDPHGVRPLVLGKIENSSWILASETCALDIIGATYIRDIEPGEMIVLQNNTIQSIKPFQKKPSKFCIFEYIYFARPDSFVDGKSVYEARKKIGSVLALESHINADLVIPVPDSGVPAAIGYSKQSKIPYELGIIRNHYVGRTFIEPGDQIRHLGVKLKHNANQHLVKNKKVILVDDSIVRGTTSRKIVEMVRNAGAKEVHLRIASPPTTHSCFYGVDTPDRKELIAANNDNEKIRREINADSLSFISINGLYRAMGLDYNEKESFYCDACFTGNYAITLTDILGGETSKQLSLLNESNK